ncbi:uncharacterized protein DEA37_0013386 [Paragonimus westermani]|uniref:Tyrosine specific protein phosphatases domain-containing protein n=1 Tax=Paragonimus westermani TaxID=34504 RepID=A0A5J4NNK1_9TREM|nr:uncharacterized protein DEA37_0013386 [Paragonimus westermani]
MFFIPRAGIGRSGTFITADILRRHLEKKGKIIDLPGVILQLRRCRPGMIQSPAIPFGPLNRLPKDGRVVRKTRLNVEACRMVKQVIGA